MSYFVYVLKSLKDKHFYIGMTCDLEKRIKAHNFGKVRSTKGRRPLELIYHEKFTDKTEAMKRERFLKSGQGRLFLKEKLSDLEG